MMRGNPLKYCLISVLICCLSAAGKDGKTKKLKPLNPKRPIYQIKEGYPSWGITWPIPGGLQERRLPDPVTLEDFKEDLAKQELRHKQEVKEAKRELHLKQSQKETAIGGWLKIVGWGLVVLGIAGHCLTTFPLLKSWSTSIITLGVGAVIGGLAIQKTVEFDKYINVLLIIMIGGLVMFLFRNWSISHLPAKLREKFNSWRNKGQPDVSTADN